MRIVIVTDAWEPQVNGVVRTLRSLSSELGRMGHEVFLVTPDRFSSIPCPTYREIRLALVAPRMVGNRIAGHHPNAVHIATEGPLGLAARRWCLREGHPFTTAYHTQFPDYLAKRTGLPAACFWPFIRWFHRPSHAVLASTARVRDQLAREGIARTRAWGRGVDLDCFHPGAGCLRALAGLPRPLLLYVGRIAVEKELDSFLGCKHRGTKVVVGDGPDLARLKRSYPDALFTGALHGETLAQAYASADALVFPSRTDTFGLVMIEALACGTPIAAFPVQGPIDVLTEEVACLDECIDRAIAGALTRERAACVAYAQGFSWTESARQFSAALVPVHHQVHSAAQPSDARISSLGA
jgi:glycosyltransferase involved in cell wall biosynthesis